MRAFTQIATPHEDILKGRLTMDVFAADLWQVAKGEAPIDYQDADLFFRKTYFTNGLNNIIDITRARLESKTGDSVIQLQTPFGGGKTHTLIALYHKAKEWNARVVVFDGTALNPEESKPWEELERQLRGKVEFTRGNVAPGKEKLIRLLSEFSPVLILMDEILEYITKAAGVKVGDSNLAAQTFAFLQELTAAVSAVGNSLLVLTLPSSILEHYDENAERTFQQLQKIAGRMEKIYTPVEDEEIEHIVRARLFEKVDEKGAKEIVDEFVEYARKEGLISGDEAVYYRDKFLRSYPFKPEVIDILYKRWGSFPTFQRTRGVLRLLSLVIYDMLGRDVPFIRLGDFNLSNEEIRRELIKHIGQEWDGIIAQDITSMDSGARKVDETMESAYQAYRLGTVVSTAIFLMSFSGRGERGCSIKEVKLSTTYPEFSSTVIDTVINRLKEKLFYLSDEDLFFDNQPNLNKIIILKEENLPKQRIYEAELEMIKRHISQPPVLKVYIHPKFSRDIPDNSELKLAILKDDRHINEFFNKHGDIPRIYKNTLFFLCPDETYKDAFFLYTRKLLALKLIENDKKLKLTENQRKELKNKLKNYSQREYEELRRFYRKLIIPAQGGLKETDLGLATFGESFLDKEIYNYLRKQGEIIEKIAPQVIKDKYLSQRNYIEIAKLYEAFLKTPGEIRLTIRERFIESIKKGVEDGLFGFGSLDDQEKVKCTHINETPPVNLEPEEIIINPTLCAQSTQKIAVSPAQTTTKPIQNASIKTTERKPNYKQLHLKLNVPAGQISTIARIVPYLTNKFNQCAVEVTIRVSEGEITVPEYEDKIKEALFQSQIEIIEEVVK